ncbi:VOC family protein [Emcibacteraceae bacterium]|nr:VOC family protein [Emcibacteraceae bacterium]
MTRKINFQRANYVVTNLERALKLYRDVLGFKVIFNKDAPDDSYSYDVFDIKKGRDMGFCVLGTDDEPNCLALTELREGTLSPVPSPRRAAIVLRVEHFDEAAAGAQELGLKTYQEDRLETNDGRVGRELGIIDFDGNLVVIYCILSSS